MLGKEAKDLKAPAFQFYPKDWLADEKVRRLSIGARGVYIDLLCYIWNTSCKCIADDMHLHRILALNQDDWTEIRAELQSPGAELFVIENGCFVSPRLRSEHEKQQHHKDLRIKAAHIRWDGNADARALHVQCSASASASATPVNNPPSPQRGQVVGFEKFWLAYPNPKNLNRKVKKAAALKAWRKFKLEARADEIVALLERHKLSSKFTSDKGKWVPMPVSWLNAEPWLDGDPLAEQEEAAAHKRRLAEEAAAARQNPIAKEIVEASQEPPDEWDVLPAAEKKAAFAEFKKLPGVGAFATPPQVKKWWQNQQAEKANHLLGVTDDPHP